MDDSVDVTIPAQAGAEAEPSDLRNREAVGRLAGHAHQHRSGPSPLAKAIAEMKADARVSGLTDADIEAELAAYNTERRIPRVIDGSFSTPRPSGALPLCSNAPSVAATPRVGTKRPLKQGAP